MPEKKCTNEAPRARGSKLGVARGEYKPWRPKSKPDTPEQLAALEKIAREIWGDEMCDRDDRIFSPERNCYVLARYYVPAAPVHDEEREEGDPTTKVCTCCEAVLDLNDFGPSRSGRGGKKSRCRTCCAEAARNYGAQPEGKAARERAQARYRAHLATEERERKARAAFAEVASQTFAGRALLSSLEEMNRKPTPRPTGTR